MRNRRAGHNIARQRTSRCGHAVGRRAAGSDYKCSPSIACQNPTRLPVYRDHRPDLQKALEAKITARVVIDQRVVVHVGVAVERARVFDKRVSLQKARQVRIVYAAVHVDNAVIVQMLMGSVAATGPGPVQLTMLLAQAGSGCVHMRQFASGSANEGSRRLTQASKLMRAMT